MTYFHLGPDGPDETAEELISPSPRPRTLLKQHIESQQPRPLPEFGGSGDPLTPAVADAIAGQGIPIPVEIGEARGAPGAETLELRANEIEPRWRVPVEGSPDPDIVPPHIAEQYREAGIRMINSDADLRAYVEARGYALVPIENVRIVEGKLTSTDADLTTVAEPATKGLNPKDAVGMTKPDLSLVPVAGSLYQAQAMMDGARKYGAYNWRSNPVLMRVYIAAAQRHLGQLLDGEDFDPISGCHHVGHALACLGIIADARETGNLVDDRPVTGPASEMIRRFGDNQSFRVDSPAAPE